MSEAGRKTPTCPICGKPATDQYKPFCSKRCADVDLNRWLGGNYAIPVDETPDLEEENLPAPDSGKVKH